jgi:hypothetical protein
MNTTVDDKARAATALIATWLADRLTTEQNSWLDTQLNNVLLANSDRDLHITLGMIPRKLGRADLELSADALGAADNARSGWDPSTWSVDCAARVYVLCKLAERDESAFADTLVDLCRNADLAESLALYNGVCLYPLSDALDRQIGEGLRTNMRAVFESIAHNSPYPAEQFDQNRWNHMVLKALFIDSTLAPIQGLDTRANAELASILCDYAHERWAAGRPVTPELWRCVGPFATDAMLEDLRRATQSDSEVERVGALLALTRCPHPGAETILESFATEREDIAANKLSWDWVAERL